MEKRNVKFQKGDAQSALLWLMSNRGHKLYDEYGNYVIHPINQNNVIEEYLPYSYEDEDGVPVWDEDMNRLDYEDFIEVYNRHVLESHEELKIN